MCPLYSQQFREPKACLWAYSLFLIAQPPAIKQVLGSQPDIRLAATPRHSFYRRRLGIYGNNPCAATLLTGGSSFEIGLYAHFNFVKGGWPRKKLLYAQNSKNQRWLEALQSAICPKDQFQQGDCSAILMRTARIVTYGRFKFGNCDINNMGSVELQDKTEKTVIFILFCPIELAGMQDKSDRFILFIPFYPSRFSELWDKDLKNY